MREDQLEAAIYDDATFSNNGHDAASAWPPLEDWGLAMPSALADVEYTEDLVRPGRILLVAAVEGVGKSVAIDGELAIRQCVAGGKFAGTWAIVRTGNVAVYSEMHRDDDLAYRDMVLAALGLEPSDLVGRYWHQNLMLTAGGEPALTSEAWRRAVIAECQERHIISLVVDTATVATGGLEPWGPKMVELMHHLRAMLATYPDLAIILVVHLRKPSGRGDRQITDVLGDWGKWCDALLLLEDDGANKTKLTTYKRVRHHHRVVCTRANGLLVEPVDISGKTSMTKVAPEDLTAAVDPLDGARLDALAARFAITEKTVKNYVAKPGSGLETRKEPGQHGKVRVYRSLKPLL